MKRPSEPSSRQQLRDKIMGLGADSARKSYYPELRRRTGELELFRTLLNLSEDLFFVLSVPEGHLLDVNDTVCRRIGWKREKILGTPLMGFVADGDAASLQRALEADDETTGRRNVHTTIGLVNPLGRTTVVLDLDITILSRDGRRHAIAIGRDISARMDAEKVVRKHRERLNLALEGADMGIWDWDIRTGEVFFDDRWATILGYQRGDIQPLLSTWRNLIHPDDYAHFMGELGAHFYGRKPFYEAEYRMRANSGEWIWILDRGKVVEYDSEGKPIRATGTHLNITEKKGLSDQLYQAQKMESIGQLAGGIAHDFNNLLTVIHGQAEIAAMGMDPSNPLIHRLTAILEASRKAGDLTGQLLAFSRKQIFNPRILQINHTLTDLEKMLSRLISEDIDLEMVLIPSLPSVKADPVQLEQVLMNLIINARDAIIERSVKADEAAVSEFEEESAGENGTDAGKGTPLEKRIRIRTGERMVSRNFVERHPHMKSGRYVEISISDTGAGMDKSTLDRAFEPFFSTKDQGKGTGLGLSTVYGIISQNQGLIEADSTPGQGSRFRILWPAVEDTDEVEEKIVPEEDLHGQERILFVEDDKAVREFSRDALESYGYTVVTAIHGKHGLQTLEKDPDAVDIVVTDLIMPEMNGMELARAVEKRYPHIRLLMASGYPGDQIARSGFLEDRFHFLRKPYSARDLAAAVRKALSAPSREEPSSPFWP